METGRRLTAEETMTELGVGKEEFLDILEGKKRKSYPHMYVAGIHRPMTRRSFSG